jgi:hypothetical protein
MKFGIGVLYSKLLRKREFHENWLSDVMFYIFCAVVLHIGFYYQPLHDNSFYVLPFIDILCAAHIFEKWLPDDGYDG